MAGRSQQLDGCKKLPILSLSSPFWDVMSMSTKQMSLVLLPFTHFRTCCFVNFGDVIAEVYQSSFKWYPESAESHYVLYRYKSLMTTSTWLTLMVHFVTRNLMKKPRNALKPPLLLRFKTISLVSWYHSNGIVDRQSIIDSWLPLNLPMEVGSNGYCSINIRAVTTNLICHCFRMVNIALWIVPDSGIRCRRSNVSAPEKWIKVLYAM
jgi:hypothetical protein